MVNKAAEQYVHLQPLPHDGPHNGPHHGPNPSSPVDRAPQPPHRAPHRPPHLEHIDALYRQHWGKLCAWLTRRFGHHAIEPEEVAQAAFEKLSRLDTLDHVQNDRAFLYKTATNVALMRLRSANRNREFIDSELVFIGPQVDDITPERIHDSKTRLATLQRSIQKLPSKQREILRRVRIEGQTYHHIAKQTGWSPADISRQLRAAMERLRQLVTANTQPDPKPDPKSSTRPDIRTGIRPDKAPDTRGPDTRGPGNRPGQPGPASPVFPLPHRATKPQTA